MIRGTTPLINITTSIDLTGYSVLVSIEDKVGTRVDIEGSVVSSTLVQVILTQEQTLSLKSGHGRFQIKAINSDGTVVACAIQNVIIEDILNETIMEV